MYGEPGKIPAPPLQCFDGNGNGNDLPATDAKAQDDFTLVHGERLLKAIEWMNCRQHPAQRPRRI
jgi:hypothetical protein